MPHGRNDKFASKPVIMLPVSLFPVHIRVFVMTFEWNIGNKL